MVKIFHYAEGFIHPRLCRISSIVIVIVPTTKFVTSSQRHRGCEVITGSECWKINQDQHGSPSGMIILIIHHHELCNGIIIHRSSSSSALCRWSGHLPLSFWHPKDPLLAAIPSSWPQNRGVESKTQIGASGKKLRQHECAQNIGTVLLQSCIRGPPVGLQRWDDKNQCTWIFAIIVTYKWHALHGTSVWGHDTNLEIRLQELQDFPSHRHFFASKCLCNLFEWSIWLLSNAMRSTFQLSCLMSR